MSNNIIISGAGLVGSLLSIFLAKRGHKITVFERRPDMRKEAVVAGRSINLALSDRGWKALETVGIADDIRAIGIPMYGRMIHNLDGSTNFLPYGKDNQAIFSVSRGTLNSKLMDLAEKSGNVCFRFNERSVPSDVHEGTLKTENTATKVISENKSDLIIGADGAFSPLRLMMQLHSDR